MPFLPKMWYTQGGSTLPYPCPPIPRWYIRPVHSLPVPYCVCTVRNTVMNGSGMWRFVNVVVHPSVQQGGRCPFSPQEYSLLPAERGALRPRNPTQKALLYKDSRNIKTPPEVTPDPPPCYSPPIQD